LKLKVITLFAAKPFIYHTSLPQILRLHHPIPYFTLSTFLSHLPHSLVDHPLLIATIVYHPTSSFYSHSQVEPKTVVDALEDNNWINAMCEELNQFARNEVWTLVPKTDQMNVIGTKSMFKNKLNEQGIIARNKARLVAKGYN